MTENTEKFSLEDRSNFNIRPDKNGVYENTIIGYKITFPSVFLDNIVINEYREGTKIYDKGDILIKFVGESKTSQILYEDYFHGGIPLYYITAYKGTDIPSESDIDYVEIIKKINNTWLISQGAGVYGNALIRVADGYEKDIEENAINFEIDETERLLAKKDTIKYRELIDCFDEIFESIEALIK